MATFNFELNELPPEAEKLRQEVREFLRTELPKLSSEERPRTWGGHNPAFSKKLAARGWIGNGFDQDDDSHEVVDLPAVSRPCRAMLVRSRAAGSVGFPRRSG